MQPLCQDRKIQTLNSGPESSIPGLCQFQVPSQWHPPVVRSINGIGVCSRHQVSVSSSAASCRIAAAPPACRLPADPAALGSPYGLRRPFQDDAGVRIKWRAVDALMSPALAWRPARHQWFTP